MGLFDSSIGGFVIGTFLNLYLLGVTSSQTYRYFTSFPNDKKVYWYGVAFLAVLDWLQSAISCYTIYFWVVQHFGNVAILAKCPWSFAIEPAITGVVTLMVQGFYTHRIWVVSGRRDRLIPAVILFLSFVALGFSWGGTFQIFNLDRDFAKFTTWVYGVVAWLASAAVADILITGTLVYYLNKSQSSFVATNNVIDRVISQVISTNGLTCAVAIIDTAVFSWDPAGAYHVIPQLCLVKLYFLSLLVSLNARIELERQLGGGEARLNSSQNDRIGQNSLTTPLGFGVNDVRPSFWSRKRSASGSRTGKKGFGGGRGADLVSQIQVQTEVRTHAGDTFVELANMPTYTPEADEKGLQRHVNF